MLCGTVIFAQGDSKWPASDASVMDMIYYPSNVAWRNYLDESQRNITPKVKIAYSRPKMNNREIFGNLVPYGQEWRLGANEATTVTFYQNVDIAGTTVPGGTYTVSADVQEKQWTINLSSEMGIWGSANRDKAKTVASFVVPTEMAKESQEALSMTFKEIDNLTCHWVIQWDKTRVNIPVGFNPVVFSKIDASPMDMAHYPAKSAYTNYLEGAEKSITPKVEVVYSRPQKKGRDIFGDLIAYGSTWRIGANEATEIIFHENAMVNGTEIKKGRYALFAEVNEDKWNMIFSKDYPIWGAANRDQTKDVTSTEIAVSKEDEVVESLSIIFEDQEDGSVHMVIAWDQTRAKMPIKF